MEGSDKGRGAGDGPLETSGDSFLTNSSSLSRIIAYLEKHDPEKLILLTPEEEVHLGKLAFAGDTESQNELVLRNVRLGRKVVRVYKQLGTRIGLSEEDLELMCLEALVVASNKYNPDKGVRFSTFANFLMTRELYTKINAGTIVNFSHRATEYDKKYSEALSYLGDKLGRAPTDDEVRDHLGISDRVFQQMKLTRNLKMNPMSLDDKVAPDSDTILLELLANPKAPNEDDFISAERYQDVINAIINLKPIEAFILKYKFGLEDAEPLTLNEIADKAFELGLTYKRFTRQRIEQISADAIYKLKKSMKKKYGEEVDIEGDANIREKKRESRIDSRQKKKKSRGDVHN